MRPLLFLLVPLLTNSQNILPNPSFELINICEEHAAKCSPASWYFVRQKSAQGFFTTNKIEGTDGNNYLGISVAIPESPDRFYWQTKTICPIIKGEQYTLKMRLSSNLIGPNLNFIGLLFTNQFLYSQNDTLLQSDRALSLADAKVKRSKHNWFEIEKTFTATDHSSHLILGNFSPKSNQEILSMLQLQQSYMILVDRIQLIPLHPCKSDPAIMNELSNDFKRHRIPAHPPTPSVPAPTTDPVPSIPPTPNDKIIIADILFDLNSFRLKSESLLDIYRGRMVKKKIQKITVIGFTDDSGAPQYNLELSLKRATEIARIISERFLIDPTKIEIIGRGISREYPEKEKNRRVEILLFNE